MNEQVLSRVREIASDVLQADVTPESSPETIESWDSVQHLNLVLAIEEEYGFQFSPEEMDQAKTVGSSRPPRLRQARRLMSLEILPYTQDAVPAVREFNQRLLAGGAPARPAVSRNSRPRLDAGHGTVSGGGRERGAGRLHPAPPAFSAAGAIRCPAAHYRLPLSEGIVESRLRDARPAHGARCARARTPPVRHGNGRMGQASPADAQTPALEDVRGAVPLQSAPPRTISAPHTRAPYQRAAPHRAGRCRVHGRGVGGHEGVRPGAPRAVFRPVPSRSPGLPRGPIRSGAARTRPTRCLPGGMRPRWTNSIRLRTRASYGYMRWADGRSCWIRRCEITSSSATCGWARLWTAWARRIAPPASYAQPPGCWSSAEWT